MIVLSAGGALAVATPRAVVPDVALTSAAADTDPPVCEVSDKLVNSCRPWLGASANKYPQVAKVSLRAQIEYHEQRIGKQLDIVHAYNAVNTTGLTADETYFASRPNTILFLNWKPVDVWSKANGSNATVNANIDANAASIKALGETKIFLTLNHEPENEVSGAVAGCSIPGAGTAGSPEDYRAMWRNVRDRFDALGVTNVVWAVVYMSQPSFACMMDDLYPGNDLVDWVYFDNYGTGLAPSFEQNVGRMYDLLRLNSDADHDFLSKPWGIAEWNINKGGVTQQQTYDYYDEAKAELEANRFPRLKAYMVYDSNVNGAENRILYKDKGGMDPVRQQHYAAFAHSPVFVATAPPSTETVAPTAPVITSLTANGGGATLRWLPSTDDVLVSDYEIYRDGQFVGSRRDPTFVDPGVVLGNTYSYTVRAIDSSENASEFSDPVAVTVTDVTAPTTPVVSTVANVDDSVTLSWEPSIDDQVLDHYEVWRGGVFVTTLTDLTFTDFTTAEGQTYSYVVYAVDAVGNRSASLPATISVLDRAAPSVPGSLVAKSPSKGTVKLTWTISTDNVGVKGYYVFRGTTLVTTLTSATAATYTVKSLTSAVTYSFTVRAFDAAGNQSAASNTASVKVR
jgi:fibronectin type 3 domain-containing protein